jgi:phosphoenolpyruvate carboxykinase (GTP)
MTAPVVPGLAEAPTTHQGLLEWVSEVAALTTPDQVVWCDGSPLEWRRLTGKLVEAGTFVRLDQKPNSFWCASDPTELLPIEQWFATIGDKLPTALRDELEALRRRLD